MKGILTLLVAFALLGTTLTTFSSCKSCDKDKSGDNGENNRVTDTDKTDNTPDNTISNPAGIGGTEGGLNPPSDSSDDSVTDRDKPDNTPNNTISNPAGIGGTEGGLNPPSDSSKVVSKRDLVRVDDSGDLGDGLGADGRLTPKIVDNIDDNDDSGGGSDADGGLTQEQLTLVEEVREKWLSAGEKLVCRRLEAMVAINRLVEKSKGIKLPEMLSWEIAEMCRSIVIDYSAELQTLLLKPDVEVVGTYEPYVLREMAMWWWEATDWAMKAGHRNKAQEYARNSRDAANRVIGARIGGNDRGDYDDYDDSEYFRQGHAAQADFYATNAEEIAGLKP